LDDRDLDERDRMFLDQDEDDALEGDAVPVEEEPWADEPAEAPPGGETGAESFTDDSEPFADEDLFGEEAFAEPAVEEEVEIEGEPGEAIPGRGRRGPPPRQQILVRRLIAVGVGILFLFLFILGFRACLESRHERQLKDFVRDVTQITGSSQQISDEFFGLLENPRNLTPLDYESEIKSNRGAMETLVSRTSDLDAPGGMGKAKSALVTTMELRRDGLTVIADEVPTALGKEGRQEATQKITDAMRSFLASDVVYSRLAATEMFNTLRRESVGGVAIPQSQFLPSLDWLELATVQEALGRVSGGQAATPGVHGLGLVSASIGGTSLVEGAANAVTASGTPEISVEVQNQGETEETDVSVTVSITGGSSPIDLDRPITRIGPGATATVTIPISPRPPSGRQVTVNVEVAPVPGEQVQDNNRASYTVTFS
jgi:hypothetical protein